MAAGKRVTPFKHKGQKGKKKQGASEIVAVKEMKQAGIDTHNLKKRMELMTAEQMANTSQIAAQNALQLFNEMLEEVRKRIPNMEDEKIVTTLLAIWDKTGGKK
jgi:hypothetical protein